MSMISVVVPAFNEERLLPDCLMSLGAQDYRGAYEVIVVDNGSTDSTADVARRFGVRVVTCSGGGGVFHARQVGAEAVVGDIICAGRR